MVQRTNQVSEAMVLLFIVGVFLLAIMIDRVRIVMWNVISNRFLHAK